MNTPDLNDLPSKCPICGAMALTNCGGTYRFVTPKSRKWEFLNAKWEECTSCHETILGPEILKRMEEQEKRDQDTVCGRINYKYLEEIQEVAEQTMHRFCNGGTAFLGSTLRQLDNEQYSMAFINAAVVLTASVVRAYGERRIAEDLTKAHQIMGEGFDK